MKMSKRALSVAAVVIFVTVAVSLHPAAALGANANVDVLVYGGTGAGVAAALPAARMGKSVVLAEPGQHVGGLTSGGLAWTELGIAAVGGGLSREFYCRLWNLYQEDSAW